jgi:hypothetical protein
MAAPSKHFSLWKPTCHWHEGKEAHALQPSDETEKDDLHLRGIIRGPWL